MKAEQRYDGGARRANAKHFGRSIYGSIAGHSSTGVHGRHVHLQREGRCPRNQIMVATA